MTVSALGTKPAFPRGSTEMIRLPSGRLMSATRNPAAGLRVAEINLPEGSLIISVLPRGKAGFVPKPDTVIAPGDEVLVVLDPGLEPQIMAQFAPNGSGG